jgi:hypothetical protein
VTWTNDDLLLEARDERDRLAARVLALEEALRYYADERHYEPAGDGWTMLEADKGKRARQTLAEEKRDA